MKTTICLTVDMELIAEARLRNLKLSKIFSDYLIEYLSIERDIQQDDLKNELIKLKAIIVTKQEQLNKEEKKSKQAYEQFKSKAIIKEI